MIKIKESNYFQFSVQERLALTIAALSRHDLEEARRLYKSCPKYKYTATDYEFTKRLDAITWVCGKYLELCQFYYDKVLLSQASISAMILAGEELTGKWSHTIRDMEHAKAGHISILKSVHQALIEFCVIVGIDSSQLLQWASPLEGRWGMNEYLSFEGIEPDVETIGYIKHKFLDQWKGHNSLR